MALLARAACFSFLLAKFASLFCSRQSASTSCNLIGCECWRLQHSNHESYVELMTFLINFYLAHSHKSSYDENLWEETHVCQKNIKKINQNRTVPIVDKNWLVRSWNGVFWQKNEWGVATKIASLRKMMGAFEKRGKMTYFIKMRQKKGRADNCAFTVLGNIWEWIIWQCMHYNRNPK